MAEVYETIVQGGRYNLLRYTVQKRDSDQHPITVHNRSGVWSSNYAKEARQPEFQYFVIMKSVIVSMSALHCS